MSKCTWTGIRVVLVGAWMALLIGGVATAADEDVAAKVDRLVQAWQPVAEERRMDEIAWVEDIRTALRVGKETRRPIFVFTHDGRMGTGRQ